MPLDRGGTEPRGAPERSVPLATSKEEASRGQGAAEQNKELMQTLDDAWNSQYLDTFASRHREDVVVRWPGQPETHGVDAHRQEAIDFYRAFPTSTSATGRTRCSSPRASGPARLRASRGR
jgi:hypothetical protein